MRFDIPSYSPSFDLGSTFALDVQSVFFAVPCTVYIYRSRNSTDLQSLSLFRYPSNMHMMSIVHMNVIHYALWCRAYRHIPYVVFRCWALPVRPLAILVAFASGGVVLCINTTLQVWNEHGWMYEASGLFSFVHVRRYAVYILYNIYMSFHMPILISD